MHAGGHHLHAGRQASGNHGLVAIGRGQLHGLQLHRAAGGVEHPHGGALAAAAFLAQRRGGQLDHGLARGAHALGQCVDRGTQRRHGGGVRGGQCHLHLVGARDGIGAGRHLAHLTLQRLHAGRPGTHIHLLAHPDGAALVLRHHEHHVARAVLGNAHHGRAGRHHLAGFGVYAGHHAGHIGQQLRVGLLIALRCQLRLGLVQRGLGGLERGLAPLQLRTTDEVLRLQLRVTPHIGGGKIALRGRGRHLGARGVSSQPVVAGIEPRQQLTCLHVLAQLHLAANELAGHAKAQARLYARAHLARVLQLRVQRAHAYGEQLDGAHRLGRRLGLGAGAQRQRGGQAQRGKKKMARQSGRGRVRWQVGHVDPGGLVRKAAAGCKIRATCRGSWLAPFTD